MAVRARVHEISSAKLPQATRSIRTSAAADQVASAADVSDSGTELKASAADRSAPQALGSANVSHSPTARWIKEAAGINKLREPAAGSLLTAANSLQSVAQGPNKQTLAALLLQVGHLLQHACECRDLRAPSFLRQLGIGLSGHTRMRAKLRESEAYKASVRTLLERAAESDETYAEPRCTMAVALTPAWAAVSASAFWQRLVQGLPGALNVQQLGKLYWAYTQEGIQTGRVADATVRNALERAIVLPKLSPATLADVCWAAARMPEISDEMRAGLPVAVDRCAFGFTVRTLPPTLLALASLGGTPALGGEGGIFRAAERMVPRFALQDVRIVFQALATFNVASPEGLRDALCTALKLLQAQGKLEARGLSRVLPVLAQTELDLPDATRMLLLDATEAAAWSAGAQHLFRIALWVMAQPLRSPALEAALCEAAGRHARDMTAAQASALLEALGASAPLDVKAVLSDVVEHGVE
jgi:hypothetical protein